MDYEIAKLVCDTVGDLAFYAFLAFVIWIIWREA